MPKKWLIIFFLVFSSLYLIRLSRIPETNLPEETPVKIIGRVSQPPFRKGTNYIINIGPITLFTPNLHGLSYGQRIEAIGTFKKRVINIFQTQYYSYYPSIVPIKENGHKIGSKARIIRALTQQRGRFESLIERVLNEPQSSLLNGILLGAKKRMPSDFEETLRRTGTLHVVVASGQNVTMLANFLMGVLCWVISRRKAVVFVLLSIVGYILMVGAEAPVVRAGIMASFVFLAQAFGREAGETWALLIAATLMLLISPLILFDLGFQLSFTAMAGMIWFYPLFTNSDWWQKKLFFGRLNWFKEALATTLSAQIMVFPVILINFGQLSLLSPFVNGLVIWVVPLVMILGLPIIILGLFSFFLSQVAAWLVWPLLTYFVQVISLSGQIPFTFLETGRLSIWWGAGYYLVVGYFLWRRKKGIGHRA
ncbi:ComEC/Rec2 family competence protein [Patescibacteria group bacterium]